MTITVNIDDEQLRKLIREIIKEELGNKPKIHIDEYITSEEAAELMRVKVQTFYNYRSQGLIKPSKMIGNKPRFLRSYIESLDI